MEDLTIFTNHYSPENFKLNKLSQKFTSDFNVNVVTQIPNYPQGAYFEGFSLFKKREEKIKKVKVKRLAVIPRGNNKIMLTLNYISYIISSFFYSRFTKDKTDHVFVYITSPIFIAYAALHFAKRNKANTTLYLLDLWPGSLISMLNIKNKFIINKLEKACIKLYKRFDKIAVSSYGFIDVLESYGVSKEKIVYIPQHAEKVKKQKGQKEINDKLKVVFTGNIGQAQNLDVLVDTAKILKNDGFEKVLFTLVGDGRYKKTLKEKIDKLKVEKYFLFKKRVDYSEIPTILENNHFGFVSLKKDETLNKTLPAKVQSYMAHGIAILSSANGEIPYIIDKANCGVSVKADSPQLLANKIKELIHIDKNELEKMANNGYNFSQSQFDLNKIVKQFIKIIRED